MRVWLVGGADSKEELCVGVVDGWGWQQEELCVVGWAGLAYMYM